MSKSSDKIMDRIRTRSKSWGFEKILEVDATMNSVESSKSSSRMRWKIVVKKNLNKTPNLPRGYLGVAQRHVAEGKLGFSKFAVYNQLPSSPLLENMKSEITLACVFRSSRGIYTHFPIIEYVNNDEYVEYFVDTGSSKLPKTFDSIEKLIETYLE
ncbi:hypothetical protein L5515_014121 [Caenorhabditis briggsae]|uniref:Uncharacterized protein n=1 Tax=Caenorhabditis briggsae TaxID=6238 RepID=A0AAE9J7U4_CAEBR|nr:hypothetical protein L5515_014121 [Caenorhabditis briggsae]